MLMRARYWEKWGKATICEMCHPHQPKALPLLGRKITNCASSAYLTWLLRCKQLSGNLLYCYQTTQTVHWVSDQTWKSLWDDAKDNKRGIITCPDLKTTWLIFHYHDICLKISPFPIDSNYGEEFPFFLTSEPWIQKSFVCKPEH